MKTEIGALSLSKLILCSKDCEPSVQNDQISDFRLGPPDQSWRPEHQQLVFFRRQKTAPAVQCSAHCIFQ